ncbi:MAG: hypothetical protein IT449_07015 [Phycisphaerales bacterium]|nr:hypothetical protein [Phycisphaerales bacterium]
MSPPPTRRRVATFGSAFLAGLALAQSAPPGAVPVHAAAARAASVPAPTLNAVEPNREDAFNRFTGRIVQTFSAPDDALMRLPSDVAVASDGRVAVADGVNDRVVIFSPDGAISALVTSDGDDSLGRPVGVTFDRSGRLWIADTDHRRLVACEADGRWARMLPVPASTEGGEDVTDLALSTDEQFAFVVDNQQHHLLRVDLTSGAAAVIGSAGPARWQFDHPFLIAADGRGNLCVSDVINGRVGLWQEDGTCNGAAGSFGVEPGQLFRPKGVAWDSAQRVWAADGRLGVVSVFTKEGEFIDVLREPEGGPMKFDSPSGLALDATGHAYVVEVRAGRVVKVEISENVKAPSRRATPRAAVERQPQACVVCHIEWTPSLSEGRSTELITLPENPPEHPLVSREDNCLSCHDGSVTDSRRRVWQDHGHGSGVTPPAGMNVPADLPLVAGQVVCRTCHSAHTRGGSGNMLKEAVFLRVQSSPSELCMRCHSDIGAAGASGMHPIEISPAAPAEPGTAAPQTSGPSRERTVSAREPARAARERAELDAARGAACLDCHTPHGSSRDALLAVDGPADTLCLQCHETKGQGLAGGLSMEAGAGAGGEIGAKVARGASLHPTSAPLDPLQRDALRELGVRDTWARTSGCLACHKMHTAPAPDALLVTSSCDGALCRTCHAGQQSVMGTAHDLRLTAPEERNAFGRTAEESGPCSACHAVHADARGSVEDALAATPQAAAARTMGAERCITCHQPDGCSPFRRGLPFAHPTDVDADRLAPLLALSGRSASASRDDRGLRCTHCHDPHADRHADFLRASPDDLCAACHAEKTAMTGGPHDFLDNPNWRNGQGAGADRTGRCGFCHGVHGQPRLALWRAADSTPTTAEGLCLECHQTAGRLPASPARELLHPLTLVPASPTRPADAALPLFDERGRRCAPGRVSCGTCHDPHAGGDPDHAMLRHSDDADPATLCARCHDAANTVPASLHSATALSAALPPRQTCGPCHAVHAVEGAGTELKLGQSAASLMAAPPGPAWCIECHREDGPAAAPGRSDHPALTITSAVPSGAPGFMPLTDDAGMPGAAGSISCTTCHATHGRFHAEDVSGLNSGEGPQDVAANDVPSVLRRSMQPMLRPFIAPNLCTQCHGEAALERFLFFHRRPVLEERMPEPRP